LIARRILIVDSRISLISELVASRRAFKYETGREENNNVNAI